MEAEKHDTVEVHFRVERTLDRQIREHLRIQAERRGVRRVTFSEFARELFASAVLDASGGLR